MVGGLAQALLDRSATGLMAFDAQRQLVAANQAALMLLGVAAVPLRYPIPFEQLLDSARGLTGTGRDAAAAALAGGRELTTRLTLTDGRTVLLTLFGSNQGHTLATLATLGASGPDTERTDPLTGLADRSEFSKRLAAHLACVEKSTAILMIDLGGFKSINDIYGRSVGDGLLRLVARRLRAAVRDADVVSRLDADEFAVLLPTVEAAETRARQLVELLSRPYLVEGRLADVAASVGVAIAPQHGTTASDLIRAGDVALSQAKADGCRTVKVFNAAMRDQSRQRQSMLEDLRRAMPLQQFELYFQPQVDLTTHALYGFEALVRWRHPVRGLVQPNHFIPLAEESGLIVPIGQWVLRAACQAAMSWPGALNVAVNVSPRQLLTGDLLPRAVAATLAASGLPPERLELEVTESALVRETEALAVLGSIREMGVRISMDDFGTGYSSLSQLRRFPFNKLKIDRSFVFDLANSHEAAAVVRAIASLGASLGMTTVAEGVETEDQEARVRLDGCSAMQGYRISPPVPAAEVHRLIEQLNRKSESIREFME